MEHSILSCTQRSKHIGALEKFEKNQHRLDDVERQINKGLNHEKQLENLGRGMFSSENNRADLMFDKIHSKRDLTSMGMERTNLINERMRLLADPDTHRFTARERFEYQTAKYERISDHLQSSSWMPKDLLNAMDYGASIADRNLKSLGVNERSLETMGLGDENLKTIGMNDNFKKIGMADDYLKKLEAANDKIQMLASAESKTFGRSLGEPIFNIHDDLVKSRGFIDDYQKAFFNHSSSLEKRLNHLSAADRRLDVAGRRWEQQIKSLSETDDLFYRRNTIEAAAMWQFGTEVITDSLSRGNYLDKDTLFARRMLEFTDDYGRFAQRTINRIKTGADLDRKAYEKSLEIAETEVSVISSTVSEIIDSSGENLSVTDSDLLQTPITSNIFFVQRYELKLKGREVGTVVNFLHIMLYEAAGSNKLRFDIQNDGYLPITPDCDIMFAIKFLRNKFYFHEQKGTLRQQEKDWIDIRDSFTRLGLPHYPSKKEEFREMQLTTIIKVGEFLDRLLQAINDKADEEFAKNPTLD